MGETKTTLAHSTSEGGLEPNAQTSFKSKERLSLAAVAAAFLAETSVPLDKAVFGAAVPLYGKS